MKTFFRILILACFVVLLLLTCARQMMLVKPDPELIGGLSSGIISKTSSIKVLFNEKVGNKDLHPDKSLLEFLPSIKGKAKWADEYTLEFEPAPMLKPGQVYNATVNLDSIGKLSAGSKYFNFTFAVKRPGFTINFDAPRVRRSENSGFLELCGRIVTEDVEDSANVERLVSFEPRDKDAKITWEHGKGSQEHSFVISGIPKKKNDYALTVSWQGN